MTLAGLGFVTACAYASVGIIAFSAWLGKACR